MEGRRRRRGEKEERGGTTPPCDCVITCHCFLEDLERAIDGIEMQAVMRIRTDQVANDILSVSKGNRVVVAFEGRSAATRFGRRDQEQDERDQRHDEDRRN